MQNRIEVFKQMLASDPTDSMVLFGLAKEYEKLGQAEEVIKLLEKYIAEADDEGNAYGSLAKAYDAIGDRAKAKEIYARGIEVSLAHGHPTMAGDYKFNLEMLED